MPYADLDRQREYWAKWTRNRTARYNLEGRNARGEPKKSVGRWAGRFCSIDAAGRPVPLPRKRWSRRRPDPLDMIALRDPLVAAMRTQRGR